MECESEAVAFPPSYLQMGIGLVHNQVVASRSCPTGALESMLLAFPAFAQRLAGTLALPDLKNLVRILSSPSG